MNASEKAAKINWLKAEAEPNTCRILSNVRCLSEGVDVPALDAVLFLTARNSQVDVVQSVGRVMRKADNKKRGYVILPVVIPANKTPEEALNDNENYKVVWQVLNALRSHDDRFDAMINKMQFDGAAKDKIEVISVISDIFRKPGKKQQENKKKYDKSGRGQNTIGSKDSPVPTAEQLDLEFEIGEIERALTAKIVKKCGNRMNWAEWSDKVAAIANTHIDRIHAILENPHNTAQKAAFTAFAGELRDDLNGAISDGEVIEMLAQHLITKPVFDALFEGHQFTDHNPMSQALQRTIDSLNVVHMSQAETKQLNEFYDEIQIRVSKISSPEGRQMIIKELYDNFFNRAFPKMAERLGIVYTPIEVVDFIIRSVEDVLHSEFDASLADKGVQIIDPFTGTGTFITRLLQSGIIPPEKLAQKYGEIHANEIVLLAYYIAAINIESTYHALIAANNQATGAYQSFEGICLTDTFQMYEKEDIADQILETNSRRRKKQKALDIKVIIGNPPYSIGQASANDNNANISYPNLNKRIEETYVDSSNSKNNKSIYDSYIKAIRWASDRIGKSGVIGFVTNGGYLESNSADGLRKCLAEEFSALYIFHLRGNQRTSGERSRKEGGKIFGSGSRAPIAISILVKNPQAKESGKICFHDIGDYLTREQKLAIIDQFGSINGIAAADGWTQIIPDPFNDWLNQRDPNFDTYKSLAVDIFTENTYGLTTSRDAWNYNFSYKTLSSRIENVVHFYNQEREKYLLIRPQRTQIQPNDIIDLNPKSISWSRGLKSLLKRNQIITFSPENNRKSLYRPFIKQNVYFDRLLNEYVYQIPKIFPTADTENRVISLTGLGTPKAFSVIMTDVIPDIQLQANGQCFPLYLYEQPEAAKVEGGLFADDEAPAAAGYHRRDAISDAALAHFTDCYPGETISKEDIFYYIYGLLHSEDYRERYADNLSKQLPRIPRVKNAADFWAFVQAGRKLAELHLHYESVPMYDGVKLAGGIHLQGDKIRGGKDEDFYVQKMKFAGKIDNPDTGKKEDDKTQVAYNSKFHIANIPLEAYEYIVNGKPALEWVMERQSVKTDKASGITNDANDWAIETMKNPRYPMELFLRVITVSLETMKIVNALPKLVI